MVAQLLPEAGVRPAEDGAVGADKLSDPLLVGVQCDHNHALGLLLLDQLLGDQPQLALAEVAAQVLVGGQEHDPGGAGHNLLERFLRRASTDVGEVAVVQEGPVMSGRTVLLVVGRLLQNREEVLLKEGGVGQGVVDEGMVGGGRQVRRRLQGGGTGRRRKQPNSVFRVEPGKLRREKKKSIKRALY